MKHHTLLHMSNSESTSPNVHNNQSDLHQALTPQLSPTATTTTQSSLVSSSTKSKASPSLTNNDVLLATAIVLAHSAADNESLADVMKGFWEVEQNFETFTGQSGKEEFCENHFKETTLRLSSGAYAVSLPKKEAISKLGESYDRAYNRFVSLEKKINKQPQIKEKYVAFMDEYSMLGHMSLVTNIPKSVKTYFLPHHCVHKEDSTTTKLRVVFDGSAKTTTGFSLNDTLHSGPTIQPKLFDTLLRFRYFKIALSGDICKMYRCVHVSYPDDYLQCILWRNSPQEKIQIYKLNTVTYGTKPAAFLAIRAMHQLAADEEDSFPVGSKIVKRDFYVDDLISGGNSVEEVIEIRKQITELLKRGNFEIRKWCTNDSDVLDGVPATDRETFLKFHDGTDITKTLGLVWDPRSDSFIFAFSHFMDSKPISKRTVLSSIARLYDPLGLVGPVITKAKVFMQNLWKGNLDWDETLPQLLPSIWLNYISSFSLVHKFVFPRFVYIPGSTIQVHAFCDASLSAYGTCVYVRSELQSEIKITLLCSKSRVAPLKALTVPKLELSAAALLADLLESISKTIGIDCEYYCWSDSMVVLSWLQEESSNYNVFVANRATHLELVHDLSTPSFLSSLKRFISIRGKPKTIWSDNATNFVGAKNELAELRQLFFDQFHMQKIYNQCTEDEIVWKFIPPRSPHFGGLWEAAVKSAKYHFYRAVGQNILKFDELLTLVCQISAILNSRPLHPITENPNDLEVLTPGHFLVGGPLTSFSEPDVTNLNINTLNRWQRVCHIQQIFWKRWSSSYLTLLQERGKWKKLTNNIAIGAMVMVKDENLPPLKWKLGRIVDTVAGRDGVIRVAVVKTASGTSRRPVSKLAILPIEEDVESRSLPTGGGCSKKPLCQPEQ
ncbi:uncharacterized protein LOC142239998 [Haematobia irritans]|uniref:uncharacterized protein LOC142239998 n=1 Tax=Haematobia irritans TaxID=7368 RepID=UPI003F5005F2